MSSPHPDIDLPDTEKAMSLKGSPRPSADLATAEALAVPLEPTSRLNVWANKLESLMGVEARGIQRIPEDRRIAKPALWDYAQMAVVWFSANCTANNLTVGVLGPIAFGLGLVDGMICCTFGTLLGSACTAYISTFGDSGNRTLVVARYTMGWWPSKLCVLLNLVIMLGYGLVDSLVAGLVLSAVNGAGMTITVGVIVSALITFAIATFGIRWFHTFERYTWIPQVLILFILIGVAGQHFDTKTPSTSTGAALAGSRLSYVFLSASGPLGWSPAAADFFNHFPPKTTNRWFVFAATCSGLVFGKLLVEYIGIGLGSGLSINPSWASAFDISTGALIVEAFSPLGTFGHFCAVLLALGIVANNIPGTYSAALSFQLLGSWAEKIPRVFWSTFSVIVYTVCAIAGRAHLLTIFLNFLSLIGYWTIIWIVMTAQEQVLFRRKLGYDWAAWNQPKAMPLGAAALTAFLIGWVGAILCMAQTYFVGTIAALVGTGADLGLPVAAAWTAVVYPPLRYMELKYMKR